MYCTWSTYGDRAHRNYSHYFERTFFPTVFDLRALLTLRKSPEVYFFFPRYTLIPYHIIGMRRLQRFFICVCVCKPTMVDSRKLSRLFFQSRLSASNMGTRVYLFICDRGSYNVGKRKKFRRRIARNISEKKGLLLSLSNLS